MESQISGPSGLNCDNNGNGDGNNDNNNITPIVNCNDFNDDCINSDNTSMRKLDTDENKIKKLWRLPDSGKISNPYFKRDLTSAENIEPKCIRIGCCNLAIDNPDWDMEYCSATCAVEHCKTAFSNWVFTRQAETGAISIITTTATTTASATPTPTPKTPTPTQTLITTIN